MKIWEVNLNNYCVKYQVFHSGKSFDAYIDEGDIYLDKDLNNDITKSYTLDEILKMEFVEAPGVGLGDLLKTTNGDFLIVSVDVREFQDVPQYGAVYMNDEDYYPPELQYLSYSLDGLMSHILRDSDLLEVVPRFKI